MEDGIITALNDLGIHAHHRDTPDGGPSLVGVWTADGRKLASIGMRIRGGVTSHGFSLNIDPDMTVFDTFVSCGFGDAHPMTSLRQQLAPSTPLPTEADVRAALARALGAN